MGTKLNVAICGGGIGGLSAAIALARDGHKITVFEAASKLEEIGASIQLPPNATKYLQDWDLYSHLSDLTVYPENLFVRRWRDGKALAGVNWKDLGKKYRGPNVHLYRSDLQAALLEIARKNGVTYHFSSRVQDFDTEAPTVILESGDRFEADFVVVADGAESSLSCKLFGEKDDSTLKYTGTAAYKATLKVSELQEYPDLAWLVHTPNTNVWIGQGRSIVTYTIHGHSLFNMEFHCPEPVPPGEWHRSEPMKEKIAEQFEDWDPIISILTYLISTLTKTAVTSRPLPAPLTSGERPPKPVTLLGSAAHIPPPYLSQTTATTIESSILLSSVLSSSPTSNSDIPSALRSFEEQRIPRVSAVAEESREIGRLWRLWDGEEQRGRDAKSVPHGDQVWRVDEGNPYVWGRESGRKWLYGWDAKVEGLQVL